MQHTSNENSLLKNDATRMKQRLSEQDEEIKALSRKLVEQQRYSHETEENMLIKDAEVCSLSSDILRILSVDPYLPPIELICMHQIKLQKQQPPLALISMGRCS